MRFTQHPSNTGVLGAPQGWNQKEVECNALPVTQAMLDGVPVVQSFWVLTAAEKAALCLGKPLVLTVWGGGMPPVSLHVEL